ncbi:MULTISPECIES: hypothetical protein [Nocardiaceae]|uniref:hypothetical protein n=1 Tax=Nocardiaceae TaxID=85025 RepID=UPI000AD840A2|nr:MULTISPECIES: hypothetical protein [Rhodococcus]
MNAIKEASVDQLDAMHRDLEQQRREAIRGNASAEQVAALERSIIRVANEFRRRGM